MKKYIDLFIQKEPTDINYNDRKSLLKLSKPNKLVTNFHVV